MMDHRSGGIAAAAPVADVTDAPAAVPAPALAYAPVAAPAYAPVAAPTYAPVAAPAYASRPPSQPAGLAPVSAGLPALGSGVASAAATIMDA